MRGNLEIVKILVQHGANVNFEHEGWTPLLRVLHEGYRSEDLNKQRKNSYRSIFNFLLQNGVTIDTLQKLPQNCQARLDCYRIKCYTCNGNDVCSYRKFYNIAECVQHHNSPEPKRCHGSVGNHGCNLGLGIGPNQN